MPHFHSAFNCIFCRYLLQKFLHPLLLLRENETNNRKKDNHYTNLKLHLGGVFYDLSKFCIPRSDEFLIEYHDQYVTVTRPCAAYPRGLDYFQKIECAYPLHDSKIFDLSSLKDQDQ